MPSAIPVNQVIHDMQQDVDYRVLWISTDKTQGYWIRLDEKVNIPCSISLSDIQDGIEEGQYVFTLDKWIPKTFGPEPNETAIRYRNKMWDEIRDLVTNEPAIYDKRQRAALLKNKERSTGLKQTNLYKYLGKYWRCGKVPDALLPDFSNCGKSRNVYRESAKKSGRPKVPGAAGKKLSLTDLQHFQSAVSRYFLVSDPISLEQTYQRMIGDYYTVKDADGRPVAPMEPDGIPSRGQFRYWYSRHKDILKEAKLQKGETNYQLQNRGETGKTETTVYGPGIACQIDATMADIFLVSRDDRSAIIGRPTMYFQMDSFSHIVTGMNISLEDPSWENAAKTILNSVESKVDYCKRYGVDIKEEEWPCMHLPSVILGDRGEMESKTADLLVNHLGIAIENAPPYRGDLKGLIEKHFDLINIDMNALPGKIKKDFGERCTEDYRLKATLDIYQFTAIIIHCVLQYNNYHYMQEYRKTPEMRQLKIKPIPRELWNYGIRYLTGGLRTMDREYLNYHLLPREEASITKRGILFRGRYYVCDKAIEEKWFDIARTDASWKVTASYNPEDAALIYISPNAGSKPIECHLLERDLSFTGTSAEEADWIIEQNRREHKSYQPTEDFHRAQTNDEIERIKKAAEKMRPEHIQQTKAERIRNIEENRKKEQEQLLRTNTDQTMQTRGFRPLVDQPEAEEEEHLIERLLDKALDDRLKKEAEQDAARNTGDLQRRDD